MDSTNIVLQIHHDEDSSILARVFIYSYLRIIQVLVYADGKFSKGATKPHNTFL